MKDHQNGINVKFEKKHIKASVDIWNSYVESGDVVFKPVTEEKFEKLFFSDKYNSLGVVREKDGDVVGFAFGTVGDKTGYVSFICVKKEYCKNGIGKELYSELEKAMLFENPEIKKIDCMFYNPCNIPWFIPCHHPHDHSGVPGVPMKSSGYPFFKFLGFYDYAIQNAYYMPLGNYYESNDIKERKERLRKNGIDICFFDKEQHFGFSELFDNIKNESWRKGVMSRLDEKIVVAVKDNKVIGYTGPLSLSEEKRGFFCGIGVHTEYRSHGIGKALFSELCAGLQNMGAEYMSLFTGENNTARFVYESTGFELVGKFSCMRKDIV